MPQAMPIAITRQMKSTEISRNAGSAPERSGIYVRKISIHTHMGTSVLKSEDGTIILGGKKIPPVELKFLFVCYSKALRFNINVLSSVFADEFLTIIR